MPYLPPVINFHKVLSVLSRESNVILMEKEKESYPTKKGYFSIKTNKMTGSCQNKVNGKNAVNSYIMRIKVI
jgi:hypothetical protein